MTILRSVISGNGRLVSHSINHQPTYRKLSSLPEIASSYIARVHLKVASSLTSSLSPKDRDNLLQTLNIHAPPPKKDEDLTPSTEEKETDEKHRSSIGEAVAVALAKDASKRKQLLEREKEEIWQRAEKATLERVQNDLLIQERKTALDRWTKQLEEEKQSEEEGKINDVNGVVVEDDDDSMNNDLVHPILGPALIDLGYKRIHVVTASDLSSLPIWEKQRVYRHERAKIMATDKLKTAELGLPGIISLHESNDGELAILDGQHRVGMMVILNDKNTNSIDLDRILVEVFPEQPSSSETHAQDLFTEINKAEPVKLVDMPGVAKVTHRRIINETATALQDANPEMFKPSQRCRAPHLNIDNLRDAIFASGLLSRHSIKSPKMLMDWMMKKNLEIGNQYEDGNFKGISASAVKKAQKHKFYLGLDSSWLYQ